MSNNFINRLQKIENALPKEEYFFYCKEDELPGSVSFFNKIHGTKLNPVEVKKGLHHGCNGKIVYHSKNYNFDAAIITYIRQRDKNESQEKKH